MITLRPYQDEAVASIYDHFTHYDGSPLIVLPTGTGKSLVIADFVRGAIHSYPRTRIMMLTHVKELIEQNLEELISLWPDAPVGIYSAGIGVKDTHVQVTFGGVQSVVRGLEKFTKAPDLILIDEAHMIPRKTESQYGQVIAHFQAMNPNLKLIGLTATPYRLDSGRLDKGDDKLFSCISYEADVADMIDDGYLSPVTSKATEMVQDVSGVGKRGGDYIPAELAAAVDDGEQNAAAVEEIIAKASDRGSWLIFCASIAHAEHIRDLIREHGFEAETLSADTSKTERARIIDDFKNGKIRALTNMGVLTTGFNAPGTDCVCLLRPTQSTGLYIQMVGRGTRLANGKDDCLVLDFAGNVKRHGPIDALTVKRAMEGSGEGEAPTKVCDNCGEIVFAGVRICPRCETPFPEPEIKIDRKAFDGDILQRHAISNELTVDRVTYSVHKKAGKPDSMRVDYFCGITKISEWVCFEHGGYAGSKAQSWGRQRKAKPVDLIAMKSSDAINYDWPMPQTITAKQNGKYFDIIRITF